MRKTLVALACLELLGCASKLPPQKYIHDEAHRARPPVANIAVNLGFQHDDDLRSLYDSLATIGVRCGIRAMSLDAQQIVVEVRDFEHAKQVVTEIIVRDHLTARVYKSPTSESLLEVWQKGRKVREEEYKLYLSPYTNGRPSSN